MTDLLLAFYGDDFTGSTDAMDALARAGVETRLFLTPPDPADVAALEGVDAVGVAGRTRSMSPSEMAAELEPAFERLAALDAPLVHYKVCSTFDSAPEVGSIGRAVDVGASAFDADTVPLLPGAPPLGRYVVFGTMFAAYDGDVYRLDRHPVMADHPVTPMDESDLRRHLSRQTDRELGLVDVRSLRERPDEALRAQAAANDVVFFDSLRDADLDAVGRLLWDELAGGGPADDADADAPSFVVGSSGVEYALTRRWDERGLADATFDPLAPVEPVAVMSGSASPATDTQITRALDAGFRGVRIDTAALVDPDRAEGERRRVVTAATDALDAGESVVMFTSRGPDDPAIERTREAAAAAPTSRENVERFVGEAQGDLLAAVVERTGPPRVCVAGGDTCGLVAPRLGIDALEVRYPLAPGVPLCRTVGVDRAPLVDEIALKGGQLGGPEYFVRLRDGDPATA
ncbi:MAG: four-carbon acid sugar kinase family protein [Halobacteriaceae archaeon]